MGAFDDLIPSDSPIAGFGAVNRADKADRLVPSRRAGLGDAGLPPAGYMVDRSQTWPGKQETSDRVGSFDPDQYLRDTARNAGPPPGFTIDPQSWPGKPELPDAPWVKRGAAGGFDPDEYLRSTANLPDAPWVTGQQYGAVESGLEGYLKGASANWRDEIYGASEASGLPRVLGGFRAPVGAGRLAYEHYTGKPGPATAEYERARDEIRARERAMQAQHPYAFGAGELGGAAATMLAVPGGTAPTVVGRLGQAARTGATYGALAGAGEGEGAADTATGAITGGVTGAGLGIAGSGLTELATPVVQRAISTVRGIHSPEDEALRKIALAAERDAAGRGGETLTPQELQAARQAGIPLGTIDAGGETMRALARSAANTSPEARAALTELTQDRFQTQSPRIAGFIRHVTQGADAAGDLETIQAAARRANRPAYRMAYIAGEDGIWNPELERLTGSPAVRQAMQAAVQRGRDRAVAEGMGAFNPGVTFDNGIMQFGRGRGAPPYPNAQYWDYVQRELRDMQTAASRAGRNEEAGALRMLHRSLLGELDAANPAFAQARQGAAGFFGAENALEAGQNFVKQSAAIPAARRALATMSQPERELFARGYASDLADAVERTGANRNTLLNQVFNSPAGRQRTQLALGPGRAQQLEAMLRIESLIDRPRTALGNSTTARQLAELGMAGGVYGAGYGLLEGDVNPLHMGVAGLTGALLHRGGQYINQRVATQVGRLLASDRMQDIARGARIAARDASIMRRLRQLTSGVITGAGTEAGTELLHQKPGQGFEHGGEVGSYFGDGRQYAAGGGAGGANDETFLADLEAAGLNSPRARGGRVPRYQYALRPGELTESNKHSHQEVGYVDESPRAKQNCGLCAKFYLAPDLRPGCLKVRSPVVAGGWCRKFVRDPEVIAHEREVAK